MKIEEIAKREGVKKHAVYSWIKKAGIKKKYGQDYTPKEVKEIVSHKHVSGKNIGKLVEILVDDDQGRFKIGDLGVLDYDGLVLLNNGHDLCFQDHEYKITGTYDYRSDL